MTRPCHNVMKLMTGILCVGLLATLAAAQPAGVVARDARWAGIVAEDLWIVTNGVNPKAKAMPVEQADWAKSMPVSFLVGYTFATDHVWRGINFTEYEGEGREKANHRIELGAEYDAREFGVIGGSIWMNWFAGLTSQVDASRSTRLHEIDFSVYWRYPVRQIGTMVELGYTLMRWPEFPGRTSTHDLWVRLAWDDTALWQAMGCDVQSSVLNPYVFYAIDGRFADWGSWFEVGVQPKWVVADIPGAREIPVLRDMWFSPKLALGVDHRYIERFISDWADVDAGGPTTTFANLVYGVELGYDLGSGLAIPKDYGTVVVAAFLHFNQTFKDILDDTLYGGVKVAWAW